MQVPLVTTHASRICNCISTERLQGPPSDCDAFAQSLASLLLRSLSTKLEALVRRDSGSGPLEFSVMGFDKPGPRIGALGSDVVGIPWPRYCRLA